MTHHHHRCAAMLLALTLLGAGHAVAANHHIYASPHGLTPHQALRQARELRRLHQVGAQDSIIIHLADGLYRLGETLLLRPEDSGTPTSPTVWRADHAGQAVWSGGMEVVMQPRPDMPGWWSARPVVDGRRCLDVRQLWRDDERVPRASLVPQDSLLPLVDFRTDVRQIVVSRQSFEPVLQQVEAARQGFDDDAAAMQAVKQQEVSNLEMIVHQRWAIAMLRVRDYEVVGDEVRLTFCEPESRLEFEHPWPQPVIGEDRGDGVKCTSGYNLLGGYSVAMPGTWYQDQPTGDLLYCAGQSEEVSYSGRRTFTVPVLHQLVEVSGSLERPVHDVTFEGVTFAHSAWTRPNEQGHVTLQGGMYLLDAYKLQVPGLPEKDYLENQAWIERPEAAVSVRGAQRISFERCTFTHLGATGLDYVWAATDCRVSQCHFADIGGTALALGAFPDRGFETHVPYRPAHAEELCRGFLIEQNLIEHATVEDWGCVGIGAGYVADVTIRDNELRELNYSGICVGWGWTPLDSGMRNNHITGNRVHHFARMLYDAGGIYTLSAQPGSTITGNTLTDIYPPRYQTNLRGFYIYLDEATDGYTISDNVCSELRFGDNRPGPHVHWGNNHTLNTNQP